MSLQINQGTQTTIYSDTVSGTEVPIVKLDVGAAGASSLFTGTLTNLGKGTVSRLEGGTLNNLATGSIVMTVGTITNGTVLPIGLRHAAEFATVVTGTGTATGTVKAAVTGSAIYVTGVVISAGTATTNIGLSSGTPTSNNVLGTMVFAANGGLALTPIDPPLRTTSGSALVWSQSGTSNVSITTVGYVN